MNYKLIIENTKKLEKKLSTLGAKGKGLHEKATSIEKKLDNNTLKNIRYIASIRNKLIHEEDYKLTSIIEKKFLDTCERTNKSLNAILPSSIVKKQGYCNVKSGSKNHSSLSHEDYRIRQKEKWIQQNSYKPFQKKKSYMSLRSPSIIIIFSIIIILILKSTFY